VKSSGGFDGSEATTVRKEDQCEIFFNAKGGLETGGVPGGDVQAG
jgi:hypothetical protein